MVPTAKIDAALSEAAASRTVPGVVAMAANASGKIYEGAFGVRSLQGGPAMTLDTVFRIASMTKAITSVAAMQMVERGKLTLDGPLPAIDPALASPQVLTGFDASGQPLLRAARRPITLKHLLTHTAGFCYAIWNPNVERTIKALGLPEMWSGKLAAMSQPLMFDPGERWNTASTSTGSAASSRRRAARNSTPISPSTSPARSAWPIPRFRPRPSSGRARRKSTSARPPAH